jgi:hypothetical protein
MEPDLLRIGKVFGRMVATRYPTGMAQGTAQAEAPVAVAGGRAGRTTCCWWSTTTADRCWSWWR